MSNFQPNRLASSDRLAPTVCRLTFYHHPYTELEEKDISGEKSIKVWQSPSISGINFGLKFL